MVDEKLNNERWKDFFFYSAFLMSKGVPYASKVFDVYSEKYSEFEFDEEYLSKVLVDKKFVLKVGENFKTCLNMLLETEQDELNLKVIVNFKKAIEQIENSITTKIYKN